MAYPFIVNGPGGANYAAPLLDFTPLSRLGDRYFEGRTSAFGDQQQQRELEKQNAFKEGVPKNAAGQPDYAAMADRLYRLGDFGTGTNLSNLDIQRSGMAAGREAAGVIGTGSLPGSPGSATSATPASLPAPAGAAQPAPRPAFPVGASTPGATPASAKTPTNGYRGGDNGLNTVASVVTKYMPEELAGPAINAAAAKLGVDPNQPLSLTQAAQLERQVLAERGQGGGQPATTAPAPATNAAPAATPGAPGAPAAPTAAPAGAIPAAAPGPQGPGRGPASIGDPSLGGIVPKPWVDKFGPDAPGAYMRYLRGVAASPGIPPNTKEAAEKTASTVADAMQKVSEPTPDMKNYQAYVQQEQAAGRQPLSFDMFRLPNPVKMYLYSRTQGETRTFSEWDSDRKKAGATQVSIDQKQETEFAKHAGGKQADLWAKVLEDGIQASENIGLVGELRRLGGKIDTGAAAVIKKYLGQVGVKTEGISDIEAMDALINKLTPAQRVPGTGATSDFDAKMFKASLPSLMNTPGGNEIILNTIEALARSHEGRADIAARVLNKDITPAQAIREMRALENPMAAFNTFRVQQDPANAGLPRVNNKADYDKLEPGKRFIGADGQPWRKPE